VGAILGVTAAQSGPVLAFITTSRIMVVAVLLLFIIVKEPSVPPVDTKREIGIIDAARQVSFSEDRSAVAILGAIFFWFFGYNAIETWFTKYGNEILGFATADASFLLNGIALAFVIFAVPAGLIAGKIGRRRTILAGLVLIVVGLVGAWAVFDNYWLILGVLAIVGVGWALVNVNSIVIVWELLGKSRLGAGTGLYYGASMGAAIFGPLITGILFDIALIMTGGLFGINLMYPVSIVFFIIAFFLTMAIKTGEVGDEEMSEVAA
ncbi:MAG: MFS transporter, partial [Candidatus Hodarchaeota archaeon]